MTVFDPETAARIVQDIGIAMGVLLVVLVVLEIRRRARENSR